MEILNARYDFHVSDNISILLTIANLRCSDFLVMTLQCTHRFLYSTDLAFLTKIGKKTLTRKSEKTEMLRVLHSVQVCVFKENENVDTDKKI